MNGKILGRRMPGKLSRCSRLDLNSDAVVGKYFEMFEQAILKK